jgi:hypothetical protein
MNLAGHWDEAKTTHASKLMRLLYVDEAGISDERQEPFAVVAAVDVNGDTQWRAIDRDVSDLCKEYDVPPDVELKAYHLFRGTGPFQSWQRERREALQSGMLKIFTRYKLQVFCGIVERGYFSAVMNGIDPKQVDVRPQDLAFVAAVGLFEDYICGDSPAEAGIIVADVSDRQTVIKASLSDYRQRPLPGPFQTQFNHITEPVLFADSKECWGIQLADHCAFFIKREAMGKADSEKFYDLIREQVREYLSAHPKFRQERQRRRDFRI